jgi:hypothetical protein
MSSVSKKGGIFKGASHEDGGIPVVVKETGQPIEVEGEEPLIPSEVAKDNTVYTVEGTNKEVLNKVLNKVGAKSINEKATSVHAGDMVVCVRSAKDNKKHKYTGTMKQIVSKVNESGGCNVIHDGGKQVFKEGGTTRQKQGKKHTYTPLDGEEFMDVVKSPDFIEWFGDWQNNPSGSSKVVDDDGYPRIVYHGTTHDFYEFTNERGNVENYFGKVFYFSSSLTEVERNYLSSGKDITSRIESLAERYEYGEGFSRTESLKKASKEIKGKIERVIPVFLDLKNPIDLRKNGTRFDFHYKLDEETGSYVDDEESMSYRLSESLERLGYEFDFNGADVFNELLEKFGELDGVLAFDIDRELRSSSELLDLYSDDGRLINYEIIGQLYERMGFDGIIQDAYETFQKGRGFDVGYGTIYYMVFRSNKIKLADGSNTTFDSNNPDIRFNKGGNIDVINCDWDDNKKTCGYSCKGMKNDFGFTEALNLRHKKK